MKPSQCKWCGKTIMWIGNVAFESTTDPHKCQPPKVRRFTPEEIEKMNIERGFKSPKQKGEK